MYMQPYELNAWLGDTELTAEQRTTLEDAIDHLTSRYADDGDAVGEGMSGALMVILGDDTLDGLGGAYRQAVEAASEAHGRLIGAVIASRDLGPSEISRQSGLSRVSVTKALR